MQRVKMNPRYDWKAKVVNQGMNFHTINDKVYWDESVCYEFDANTIDRIEDATKALHDMSINYVHNCIARGDYTGYWFNNNQNIINLIEQSWKSSHQHLYGRFDLGIDRSGNIKMFEYNADTPTSLLEASVIQWNWKEDVFPNHDQFNSIHEKLISRWNNIVPLGETVYVTANANSPHEDWSNLHYVLQTAVEAGYNASSIDLEMIGWAEEEKCFVDTNNYAINYLFKLYPWEWLVQDEFCKNIPHSLTTFFEPPWKMLLSNKLLCVKLWEMNRDHPLLLPAFNDAKKVGGSKKWIQKPMLGREGNGVEKWSSGWFSSNINSDNIIQEKFDVATFDGMTPVIGSWVIGNDPAGIGIREDTGITTNNSRFIPHYFVN